MNKILFILFIEFITAIEDLWCPQDENRACEVHSSLISRQQTKLFSEVQITVENHTFEVE